MNMHVVILILVAVVGFGGEVAKDNISGIIVYECHKSGKNINVLLTINGYVDGVVSEIEKSVKNGQLISGGPGVMVSPPEVAYKLDVIRNGKTTASYLISIDGSSVETDKGVVQLGGAAVVFLSTIISGHVHSLSDRNVDGKK